MNRVVFARGVVSHHASSPSLLARVVHDLTALMEDECDLKEKYLVDESAVDALILAARNHPNFDPDLHVAGQNIHAQNGCEVSL